MPPRGLGSRSQPAAGPAGAGLAGGCRGGTAPWDLVPARGAVLNSLLVCLPRAGQRWGSGDTVL